MARLLQLQAHRDGVLDAASQGIIGIDEQDRAVGVDFRVLFECFTLPAKAMIHEWAMVPRTGMP